MVDKLTINDITYEWLEKTSNPKLLKKALKLLKDDGDYFPDLSKAIDTKLQGLDEKYKQRKLAEHISEEDIKKSREQLDTFIKELNESEKIMKDKNSADMSSQLLLKRQKEADNEKYKGNELMRTKEYDEAIKYYTKSINLYEFEPTTYCNRALAYLKIMQYNKAIMDCDTAISMKKDYIKAYYRRALCNSAMKKYSVAMEDFLIVLNDNPKSKEINEEITKCKKEWIKAVGEDEWNKVCEDFEYKLDLALNGKYNKDYDYSHITEEIKNMDIKEEKNKEKDKEGFVKVNIVEDSIKEQENKKEEKKENSNEKVTENKKEDDSHKGFKKIQIEEDDD